MLRFFLKRHTKQKTCRFTVTITPNSSCSQAKNYEWNRIFKVFHSGRKIEFCVWKHPGISEVTSKKTTTCKHFTYFLSTFPCKWSAPRNLNTTCSVSHHCIFYSSLQSSKQRTGILISGPLVNRASKTSLKKIKANFVHRVIMSLSYDNRLLR